MLDWPVLRNISYAAQLYRFARAQRALTCAKHDDCIYWETATVDKQLTLKAGSGVEIRGSDV